MGKLSDEGTKFLQSVSGWTATLLFMWMGVAQMVIFLLRQRSCLCSPKVSSDQDKIFFFFFQWTNLLNPENIKGLSAISMLLAMIGNGLMIPRALLIRDLMWYVFPLLPFIE